MNEPTNEQVILTDFWGDLENGRSIPEYFNQALHWKNRNEWPEGLEKKIEERHGKWQWGYNWDCVDLPDTNYVAVMVRRIPNHSTDYTHVPGLTEGNTHYDWQNEMVEVNGIYFFDKGLQKLISVKDLVARTSTQPVRIYIYGAEATKKSPMVMRLEDKGQPYHAVFVHSIKKIGDILGLFHELGHILVDSKSQNKYKEEYEQLVPIYKRDAQAANDEVERYGNDITDDILAKIMKAFHHSKGFQQAADLEMRLEVDAWSAALFLLNEVGITDAFEKGDGQLSDYMIYCVKTRIPEEV